MQCAVAETPLPVPALLAGSLPRASGGEPCPELAQAARACAGPERPTRRRGLRLGAKAAAVALHVALLLLVVFLESLPAPVAVEPTLVCTLDLDAALPGPPAGEACPAPAAAAALAPQAAPKVESRPIPAPRPKPAPKPAPVPEEAPVSDRESATAKAPEPAPAPVAAAEPAPAQASPPAGGPQAAAAAGTPGGLAAGTGVRGGKPGVPGGSGRGFELSQVDQVPRLSRRFEPEYPYSARSRNLSGTVTVRFLVDVEGHVDELTVVSAEPAGVFEDSVLKAVRRWRFKPGERGGKPVPTWVVLPVRFDLTG